MRSLTEIAALLSRKAEEGKAARKFTECLTWACEGPGEFKRSEACSALGLSEAEFNRYFYGIFVGGPNTGQDPTYALSSEAFYRYVEVIELQEARQSAREARWYAIVAICVSIIMGGINIWQGWQIADDRATETSKTIAPAPMLSSPPEAE